MHSNPTNYKSWVEISKKALYSNLSLARKIAGKNTKIVCVVKANAYGHGLTQVASLLAKNKNADWFAVDSLEEALVIRGLKIKKPILVLGYIPPINIKNAVLNSISIVCYNEKTLRRIASLNLPVKAKIHLKIETGLNRQGLNSDEALGLYSLIKKFPQKLLLEGIYSHFADIEDTSDPTFAFRQLERFKKAINLFKQAGAKNLMLHTAASAAFFLYPQTRFNVIRFGISLYGLWPSEKTKNSVGKNKLNLKPVLTWKSIVVQVKEIQKGESVGYARTWIASRKAKIAIIPVGYFDGFDRGFSNNGRVLIRGEFAPVVGRVAMNMIMADVSKIKKAKEQDEVVLLGKSGENIITAEELAKRVMTINYEIVSRINSQTPRIIVQ